MAEAEKKESRMEFLIGIPSGKTINAGFDSNIQSWINKYPVGKTTAISNRVDWNRNIIWNRAKEYDTSLIMIDTDVYPIESYDKIKQYIYEDFAEGYDVVFAPLYSHDGNLLFGATNMDDYDKETPYNAFWSGFGFTAFSKRLIRSLEPLTHLDIMDESMDMINIPEEFQHQVEEIIKKVKNNKIEPIEYHALQNILPIYFTYSAQHSEDSQFCWRMRKLGIKMCIDPRIKCSHMTEVPFIYNIETVRKALEKKKKEDAEAKQKAIKEQKVKA